MGLFEIPESLELTIVFAVLSGVFLTLATGATHLPAHIDRLVDELESDDATGMEAFIDDDNAATEDTGSIRTRPTKVTKKMWRVVSTNKIPFRIGFLLLCTIHDLSNRGCLLSTVYSHAFVIVLFYLDRPTE